MKSIGSILKEVLITEGIDKPATKTAGSFKADMPYTVSPAGQVIISLDFKLKKAKFLVTDLDLLDAPGGPYKEQKMTPEQQLEWYFDLQDMLTVKDFKYDKKANTVIVNTKKPDKANETHKAEVDEFVNGLKRQLTKTTKKKPKGAIDKLDSFFGTKIF